MPIMILKWPFLYRPRLTKVLSNLLIGQIILDGSLFKFSASFLTQLETIPLLDANRPIYANLQ